MAIGCWVNVRRKDPAIFKGARVNVNCVMLSYKKADFAAVGRKTLHKVNEVYLLFSQNCYGYGSEAITGVSWVQDLFIPSTRGRFSLILEVHLLVR
ncbi:hypothetical protein TNCV_2360741 [Trichonephila clavipes]|nr:hypothetical protein TNCV_2360741 [Trichonephila clavipes]